MDCSWSCCFFGVVSVRDAWDSLAIVCVRWGVLVATVYVYERISFGHDNADFVLKLYCVMH